MSLQKSILNENSHNENPPLFYIIRSQAHCVRLNSNLLVLLQHFKWVLCCGTQRVCLGSEREFITSASILLAEWALEGGLPTPCCNSENIQSPILVAELISEGATGHTEFIITKLMGRSAPYDPTSESRGQIRFPSANIFQQIQIPPW